MRLWQYCLLVTARLLYMFRTLSATAVATDLGYPYWISRPMACTSGCYSSF